MSSPPASCPGSLFHCDILADEANLWLRSHDAERDSQEEQTGPSSLVNRRKRIRGWLT
jgi:hypothetical protein